MDENSSSITTRLMVHMTHWPTDPLPNLLTHPGEPVPFEDYAEDCRLYVPDHPTGNPFFNFTVKMDRFVLAHIFGWMIKVGCVYV